MSAEPGSAPAPTADPSADLIAGRTTRPAPAWPCRGAPAGAGEALVAIDATSAAGGLPVDISECDVYYFAPQKCFASMAACGFAIVSPAALERIAEVAARTDRWIPEFLSLTTALDNSVKDQTYNTPALATILMLDQQLQWMNENGGLAFTTGRTKDSSDRIYTGLRPRPSPRRSSPTPPTARR